MQNLPHPIFSHLINYLVDSIREDIENCIEISYKQLAIQEYCQMINWKGTVEEAALFIAEHHVCCYCELNLLMDRKNGQFRKTA